MILGKVCRWFCNNRIPIQDYFNDKNESLKPKKQRWVYTSSINVIMNEVNYVFQYSKGKQTTFHDQIEYLITLNEYINTTFKFKNEPGKDSENVSFKGYTIEKYNAVFFY